MLLEWRNGDHEALNKLMPIIYDELRQLASKYMRHERQGHTLQTTGLVHEAYCRLVDQTHANWQNRAQFIGVAAQIMRRILVDHARNHQALKRGSGEPALSLVDAIGVTQEKEIDLIALNDALADSEEIRRHLEGLPLVARKDTLGYRTTKFIKRNKIAALAGTIFLLLILGFGIAMAIQANRIAHERDKARQISAFLVNLFSVSDPSEARGKTITARELLDEGAKKIATELKDQPLAQASLINTRDGT